MDKKISLNLNTKPHTGFGLVSFALGIVSLVLFVISVVWVAFYLKESSLVPGLLETLAMVLSLVGIAFGLIGEIQEDVRKSFAHGGIFLNLLIILFHITVLIKGY